MLKQLRMAWNRMRAGLLALAILWCAGLANAEDATGISNDAAVSTSAVVRVDAEPGGISINMTSRPGDQPTGLGGNLVALAAVVLIFGLPVFIVGMILLFRYRRDRLLHSTIEKMIEKGVPIPTELFDAPRRSRADLRRGVFWIALGTGALVYLKATHSEDWLGGLIPLLIGIAYLVMWRIEQGKRSV